MTCSKSKSEPSLEREDLSKKIVKSLFLLLPARIIRFVYQFLSIMHQNLGYLMMILSAHSQSILGKYAKVISVKPTIST